MSEKDLIEITREDLAIMILETNCRFFMWKWVYAKLKKNHNPDLDPNRFRVIPHIRWIYAIKDAL